jgi:hypothetical protein
VFLSAIAGVFFLFAATLISWLALMTKLGCDVSAWWHGVVPVEHSGKAAIAFLLGACLWFPANLLGNFRWLRFLSRDAAIDREVENNRNPLEILCRQAMKNESVVAVTLKSGKVYIGRISTPFDPAFGMQAIDLVLLRSGHRNKDTQRLTMDVDYEKTHAAILAGIEERILYQLERELEENPSASWQEAWDSASRKVNEEPAVANYLIAMPVSEVQSVQIFDLDIYDQHFAPKNRPDRPKPKRRRG